MIPTPTPTEYVYEMSDEDKRQMLENHFDFFYELVAENKFVANAAFENVNGVKRCLVGIPHVFLNAVFSYPEISDSWDESIQEQLDFFGQANVPFVWYVDEEGSSDFKQKLIDHGFQNAGVFRGVVGPLNRSIPDPVVPEGCSIELVQDLATMNEFNDLVCATFGMEGVSKEMYLTMSWNAATSNPPVFYHWLMRKDGQPVAAVSTMIQGDLVSFWNGATLPEVRRHGFSTAIRYTALKDAIAKGCHWGSSYLMAEGMAFGICSKLGYQTKWRFDVFVAPQTKAP